MKKQPSNLDRRQFLKKAGLGIGLSTLATSAYPFADLYGTPRSEEDKLGIALVGLGGYSKGKLAPAFEFTKFCKLSGIVTGSPDKAKEWMEQHNIPEKNVYNYDNFDTIADNPDIDIVYVVLPNAMHADYVIRAAKAGKHVICEKPFDISVKKAQAAVDACKAAGKLLQIGYRCQYDPFHQEIMRIGREKVLGDIKVIRTSDSFFGVNSSNWRFTDRELAGGGALMDIGVYCIQGARYSSGEEPVAVWANTFNTYPGKMDGMEETITFTMEFPSGAIANCTASYVARADELHISAEKGNYGLEPGYGYAPPQGYMQNEKMDFERHNQQAVQMDAFARNILDGTPVIADGEEGVQDMRVIEAIYKSAKKGGKRVKL
ncbi:Gfo/Idh/MocA family protein [Flavilitoribacter nigricans]|uniref:Glucose-fructose oxidoreductase n=1 Tax=Flavilitoribacter nigricans (strain ATCC 23147 / DSM 23189 / NBRC 102662 / NCIMB 1420 / SS-2) TaxID=1122177 RepID=A0A2D0NCB8_FLAN2|nr:Gfo/Idh/MocA family oxidoreductase [Flavilitoribacter nigricans]PHN06135.1 glucose-fructose oxidoreductase [Flavilitoribacter nigricans DSM 23189 = NBRC 102662]